MTAGPTPRAVNDQYVYAVVVANQGGSSNSSILTINLPAQLRLVTSSVDRGPGCSSSGQTLTCPLDFFPSGLTSTVFVTVQVAATGTFALTTSTFSSPSEQTPGNGVANLSLSVGSVVVPPATPSVPAGAGTSSKALTFSVSALKKVALGRTKPKLTLVLRASKAGKLNLALLGARKHTLTHWSVRVASGTNRLSLLLPVKARTKGQYLLRISVGTGTAAKTFKVTVTG